MEQNNQNTALLVMDMQAGLLGSLPDIKDLIGSTSKAITKARNNKIPVIYVVVGFRSGFPEVSMNNKTFAASKVHYATIDMEEFMQVHPDLAPIADEVTVVKRRYSAFTGSDLEVVLRAQNIKHIIFAGVSTSGVILSTLREAADKDYRITVLSDCCLDRDEEVHRVLMTKVFPRQAEVITVGEWK